MHINQDSESKSDRIISFITESVRNGDFAIGKAIPSINSTAHKFCVARKTVVRAYGKLKEQGIIESRPKVGFFVVNKRPNKKIRVLLIVQSFDAYWEVLYNEFRGKVANLCEIEIYFHHYNIKILELILTRNRADYDLFIISSFNNPRIKSVVGHIPAYKVFIISRNDFLNNSYNAVVQDFFEGTYRALCQANSSISKYNKINLSYPEKGGHSKSLIMGFLRYCTEFSMPQAIFNTLNDVEIVKGEVYLIIDDNDLIRLLNVCKSRKWILGRDIGVISYNETPLKQIIRDGISVISCDFLTLANEMAAFIKSRKAVQKVIPIEFIKRNSL